VKLVLDCKLEFERVGLGRAWKLFSSTSQSTWNQMRFFLSIQLVAFPTTCKMRVFCSWCVSSHYCSLILRALFGGGQVFLLLCVDGQHINIIRKKEQVQRCLVQGNWTPNNYTILYNTNPHTAPTTQDSTHLTYATHSENLAASRPLIYMDMYGCISTSSTSSSSKYNTWDGVMYKYKYKYKTKKVLSVEYSTVRRNIFLSLILTCTSTKESDIRL
jgi:hypothetical protein